jgi:CheY-like chemotaxis protein
MSQRIDQHQWTRDSARAARLRAVTSGDRMRRVMERSARTLADCRAARSHRAGTPTVVADRLTWAGTARAPQLPTLIAGPGGELAASVLVVDDHDDTRRAIVQLIRHQGVSVVGVRDGGQCLAYLEVAAPRLIVLDYNLPELDGLSVLRRIRAEPRWADVTVVMFSAADATRVGQEAIAAGAVDFIEKGPDTWPKLMGHITQYAGTGRAAR